MWPNPSLHLKRCRGPRSALGTKLLKNTKEVQQGLDTIYWERTREKIA